MVNAVGLYTSLLLCAATLASAAIGPTGQLVISNQQLSPDGLSRLYVSLQLKYSSTDSIWLGLLPREVSIQVHSFALKRYELRLPRNIARSNMLSGRPLPNQCCQQSDRVLHV
jgi:hypothetical protein